MINTTIDNCMSGIRMSANGSINHHCNNNIICVPDDAGAYGIYSFYTGNLQFCDYNCIYSPGKGYTGYYNLVSLSTLVDWQMQTPFGGHSINSNPQFADLAASDFHLKSTAGRWDWGSWAYDTVDSPCIDAGDPSSSYSIEPSPNGGRINMGFYGNTIYASRTEVIPAPPTGLRINGEVNPLSLGCSAIYGSAIYIDEGAPSPANAAWVQIDNNSDFSSLDAESGWIPIAEINSGSRCENLYYEGTPLETNMTYYWRIKFRNTLGQVGEYSSEFAYFKLAQNTQTLQFKGYHLLELPCDTGGKTFAQLFGDDISGALIIYYWDAQGNSWEAVNPNSVPQDNLGYFIWSWSADTILGMDGDPLPDTGEVTLGMMSLDPGEAAYNGYHLIRNPFGVSLAWPYDFAGQNCDDTHWRPWNGTEYEWCIDELTKTDGGSEFIPPGASFWVHCTEDCGSITMNPALGGAPRPLPPPALQWRARLLTCTGNYKDTYTYFGLKENSLAGYDDYDVVEIKPFTTKYVETYFHHSDWGRFSGPYTQDMRPFPEVGGKVSWDFTIHATDANGWINMSWVLPQEVESCWSFLLKDNYSGLVTRMNLDNRFEYQAAGNDTRTFTITATEQKRLLLGDTDLDGTVTVSDAAICARSEHELETLTARQRYVSDLNSDGNVDNFDALLILRRLEGHIPDRP
jgi:hypothetical protein